MNAKRVIDGLNILQVQMAGILDQAYVERALGKARNEVQSTEQLYCKYRNRNHIIEETGWGFEIREPALRFRETEINGYRFYVDIVCDFRWKDEVPHRRDIVLRLWTLDDKMLYRPQWDSDMICRLANGSPRGLERRVMLRFHFDMAREGASELKYHMQVGGVAQAGEYCWLPSQIDVPRFPYPPVDLFLMCELIGANFYPHDYEKIRTDGTWVHQILRSQETLLRQYYDGCCKAIRDDRSILMDYLWGA
jgi:hypothetical protein